MTRMSVRSSALDGSRAAAPEDPRPAAPPARGGSGRGPRLAPGSLSTPLRYVGYATLLTVLTFIQSPGLMVADTKFDLLTAPGRFLLKGLRLWDPHQAFGQVPDQAYGYIWPMGPFFALGHLLSMPPWMIQRLWWALLLCLAFFGMLRLLKRLEIGSEATQLVAALAFVLTPRLTTLIGVVSVEVWPMALAPWVLLPLVTGSREGSVRRAAARSALVVACCGGVNAVAVAAVLPLGVVWLLTREPGPRRWPLFGWWTLFTVLATAWWSGPLALLGRYAPPFLDYIENSAITTLPTDLTRSLLGVSDWVAYFGGPDFGSGLHVVGTPYLLLDAAAVAALGLVGMCLSGNPHRRFLVWGLLTGLVLVGFGYSRDLPGFFSTARMHSLDLALAPFRNVHKFDVVLRIPLVLGLAYALHELPERIRALGSVVALRVYRAGIALAVIALLTPWLYGVIPASGGVAAVPAYWQQTADYLAAQDDGSVALELPAAAFGQYSWGNTHDDILQGLARSPWAARNVVPLAQPGNVVFLDAVTRMVESGRPSPTLATYLADNGVGTIVVRNDLDRLLTGAPDPAFVRSVLTATPGLSLVRSFGPVAGPLPYAYVQNSEQTRIVQDGGLADTVRSVDVYRVVAPVTAALTQPGEVLVGDPSSGSDPALAGLPVDTLPLAADATSRVTGQVLTDDLKRREMNFPAVRWNQSATMTGAAPFRLAGKEQTHRIVEDDTRWSTVETWTGGVSDVEASSSQAYADATPPLAIGDHPGAVFDNDPTTEWRSAVDTDPKQQWWQVDFTQPRNVGVVSVAMARDSVPLKSLLISGGGRTRVVPAPAPGLTGSFAVGLPHTSKLRIAGVYTGQLLTGAVALSEVRIDNLHPQRWLTLPAPVSGAPVDVVALSRDPDRFPCSQVRSALVCSSLLQGTGEDGDVLARRLLLPDPASYDISATASLRRSDEVWQRLLRGTGVSARVTPPEHHDPADGTGAMLDGDPATTWVSHSDRPVIHLTLAHRTRLRTLRLAVDPGAPASVVNRAVLNAPHHRPRVVDFDRTGWALHVPRWRVRHLTLAVGSVHPALAQTPTAFRTMPPGITEIRLNGASLTRDVYRNVVVPCGQGPKLLVGNDVFDTTLAGHVGDLLRGASMPLELCGTPISHLVGHVAVAAGPTRSFRVDSVTLRRFGSHLEAATPVAVHRDGGLPSSVDLPARSGPRVLSLPQNLNPGYHASLNGAALPVQAVDSWQQGWVVPAGPAATVQLRFAPQRLFDVLLVVGALLVLVVVAAAIPWRRRTDPELPPLTAAGPGRVDVVLVAAVLGFLAGWAGLGALALTWVLYRRFDRLRDWWVYVAGVELLVATAALTWGPLKASSWALDWAQVWAALAVATVSVVLLAPGTPGRFAWRRTPAASSSERS